VTVAVTHDRCSCERHPCVIVTLVSYADRRSRTQRYTPITLTLHPLYFRPSLKSCCPFGMAPLTGTTPLNRTPLPCHEWRAIFLCSGNDSDGTCRLASAACPSRQSKITEFDWMTVCPAAIVCFQASAGNRLPYSAYARLFLNDLMVTHLHRQRSRSCR
jgi:hypothetical protein